MSHASSIDFNIESQYNVKWSFLVLLQRLVIPGSGIFQIHIPIWIFLDCVIVIICVIKLLWFASIYFNIILAPVSTTVITGCYFWMITFFRPFPLPLSHLLIFPLSVGFLVFITTLPFYLELESKGFNFTNFFFESSKTWYNNWHMLLTITTNNWYMLLTTTTDDL